MDVKFTIEKTDDGQETVINGRVRPPSTDEREGFNRRAALAAVAMKGDDPAAKIEAAMGADRELTAIGAAMLYWAEGEIPEWAEGCKCPKDVIVKYFGHELGKIAAAYINPRRGEATPEQARQAMEMFMGQQKAEGEQTKN